MKLPDNPLGQTAAARPAGQGRNDADSPALRKACRDFEAIFLHSLFKGMRTTAVDGGLFEKSRDRELFEDMLDSEVAKAAADQNALDVGRILLREFEEGEDG